MPHFQIKRSYFHLGDKSTVDIIVRKQMFSLHFQIAQFPKSKAENMYNFNAFINSLLCQVLFKAALVHFTSCRPGEKNKQKRPNHCGCVHVTLTQNHHSTKS